MVKSICIAELIGRILMQQTGERLHAINLGIWSDVPAILSNSIPEMHACNL